jgi:hypothetical protein
MRDPHHRDRFYGAIIVSWHDARPLVYQYGPAYRYELMEWDLETGQSRSFDADRSHAHAARSPDGRWLIPTIPFPG